MEVVGCSGSRSRSSHGRLRGLALLSCSSMRIQVLPWRWVSAVGADPAMHGRDMRAAWLLGTHWGFDLQDLWWMVEGHEVVSISMTSTLSKSVPHVVRRPGRGQDPHILVHSCFCFITQLALPKLTMPPLPRPPPPLLSVSASSPSLPPPRPSSRPHATQRAGQGETSGWVPPDSLPHKTLHAMRACLPACLLHLPCRCKATSQTTGRICGGPFSR